MTTKEIKKALLSGKVVVLRDEPHLRIVPDLFGKLVVVSCLLEPFDTRLATVADKRKAIIYEKQVKH